MVCLATCGACQLGLHDSCEGYKPPPEGMLGGFRCNCDHTSTPPPPPWMKKLNRVMRDLS